MIKLVDNIYWNENSLNQSDEAITWMQENVLSKLGINSNNPEFISPELDEYNRPFKWTYTNNNATVVVTREYIAPAKWAKKNDNIKVISNE